MNLLIIDTSAHQCTSGIFNTGRDAFLSEETVDLGRGHAEHLIGQIERCLQSAERTYTDLDRIVVSTGPGSFTGVRVGLAVARGLALSLEIPLTGVNTLEACREHARQMQGEQAIAAVLDAKRNQAYYQLPARAPTVATYDDLVGEFSAFEGALSGSGAKQLTALLPQKLPIVHELEAFPTRIYAELGKARKGNAEPPEPMYLRGADAKPQSGFALERADG